MSVILAREKNSFFLHRPGVAHTFLRGLPFGQPPFFAFCLMAASFAGLLDLPPSFPIREYHFLTAAVGVGLGSIVNCVRHFDVTPRR